MSATRKSNENIDALVGSLVKVISKYAPKSDEFTNVNELLNITNQINRDYNSLSETTFALAKAQADATKAFGSKDLKAFSDALKIEYPLFGQFEKINASYTKKGYDDLHELLQPLIKKIPRELGSTASQMEAVILDIKDSVTAMSSKIKSDHVLLMTAASKLSQMKKNMATSASSSQVTENANKSSSGPLFKPAPAAATTSTAQIIPAHKTMKSNGQ